MATSIHSTTIDGRQIQLASVGTSIYSVTVDGNSYSGLIVGKKLADKIYDRAVFQAKNKIGPFA